MSDTMLDGYFARLHGDRPEFTAAIASWRDELGPELERREDHRKAVVNKAIKQTAITGAIILGLIWFVLVIILKNTEMVFFMTFAGIMLTALASSIFWLPVMTMKSQTKELIVGAACKPFGFSYETLHMDVSGVEGVRGLGSWIKKNASSLNNKPAPPTEAFDVLAGGGLMPSYDTRKFEDMIIGTRAGADFSLVECKLTETQGSGKNRRTVTKFQGLLVHVQYPDKFLGRTLIARDGWWKRGKQVSGLTKVDLVSKELEDAFTVYSNDQVEARSLLTPDRMERLIALERHFKGGKLRGVFDAGHLTIALEAKDQFEAGSVFKTLVDPTRYVQTLIEIGLLCDLIDGFLTRDWYKQKLFQGN